MKLLLTAQREKWATLKFLLSLIVSKSVNKNINGPQLWSKNSKHIPLRLRTMRNKALKVYFCVNEEIPESHYHVLIFRKI